MEEICLVAPNPGPSHEHSKISVENIPPADGLVPPGALMSGSPWMLIKAFIQPMPYKAFIQHDGLQCRKG